MSGVPTQPVPLQEPLAQCRSQVGDSLCGAGIAYWHLTVATGVLEISANFIAAYGYKPEDLLPLTLDRWQQLIHPDDGHVLSLLDSMINGQVDTMDTIYRSKTASGEWRYFLARGSVAETSSADNKAARILGVIQDITDLREAEAAMQRRDRMLAAVNEAANILLTTSSDTFEQSISQVLHVFGTAAGVDRVYVWQNESIGDELYCSQIYEWLPDESQRKRTYAAKIKLPLAWEQYLSGGECVHEIVRNTAQMEQSQLHAPGTVSLLVAPILLRNEFWGFIGFDDYQNERVWDRTEMSILKLAGMWLASAIQRQQTELDLAYERRTLDWIIESSPVAVLTSFKGKVSGLNKRGRELFAVTEGTPLPELYAKILGEYQGRLTFDLILQEMIETGVFFRRDIRFPCADGVVRDFIVTSFLQEPNNVQRSISWIIDITELKETERALIQARDKAETATKAKSDFLARMSHEIRTPMNAILGMIYLCLQTKLDDKQRDYLTKTQNAANNLLGIINDILDISKIEAGKFELESIPFSLKKTVEEIIDIVRTSAEGKGLKLITKIDSEICDSLIGDPLRLRQILLNLINNAVKFTAKGGIFLTVSQDESSMPKYSENIRLVFEVKDTGIGLQADQLENIFESFAQADGSTTRKYGGTGLGLAIVKNLVELMGGQVNVASIPGQGATFQFTVVFVRSHVEPDMSSAILLNKRRILLIDDNANDLEILAKLMQSMRMDVLPVRSGVTALEKLEEATYLDTPFELVLIDWRMPRMDGIETVRQIRQNKKIIPPYIIMVSAYDRQDCLRQVQGLNVSDVLVKPMNPHLLKEALKTTFRKELTRKTNEVRADIRGSKVLLAEDNKINQMVASELLHMMNVEVTIANNGVEAVEAVKKQNFDLILMDIQMPEMDGLTAAQAIRHLDKSGIEKLPILAMTANALDTDYQRSLAVGMNDHLTKPIDPEKLRLALEKWIVR
jgi:PAS domain S-box-containing protein